MSPETDHLETADVLSNIFDANTLEEAIFWRQVIASRLRHNIEQVCQPDGLSPDEVHLHQTALTHVEISLAHLRLSLLNKERMNWSPESRTWFASNVWQAK